MHKFLCGTLDFRSYDKEIVVAYLAFSASGDYAVLDFQSSRDATYEFKVTAELGATAPGFNLVSLIQYPLANYPETQVRLSLNRRALRFLYDSKGKPFAFVSGFWHETFKGKYTDYYFSGLLESDDAKGSGLSEAQEAAFLSKIQTKINRTSRPPSEA